MMQTLLDTLLLLASGMRHRLRFWRALVRDRVLARADPAFVFLAVAAPAFFFLYGLGAFPLRDNNEGLYAEIAREMLADGDWLIPHLNGLPYLEKPPLLYWLMAGSMAVFGNTAGGARLVSALSLVALALGMFGFARRHLGLRVACFGSTVFASMVPVALMAHLVLFDPLLCAFLGGSLLCYLHAGLAQSRRAQRLAALLLALAVLEKGAVALVLAVGSCALFLLLTPRRQGRCWRLEPGMLALFLLLVLPWHLLAAWRQQGFTWFYVVNEHILRFLGRRQPDDYRRGPLFYYLPRLFMMALPWTPFLFLRPRREKVPGPRTLVRRFCLAATLFSFLFFSLSQAKADYYLIVIAPFVALLLALALDDAIDAGADRRTAWCWSAAVACCIVAIVTMPGEADRTWSPLLVATLALAWLCLALVGARAYAILSAAREREWAMLAIAVLAAPLLVRSVQRAEARAVEDSSRHIANVIDAVAGPAPAVFLYRDFEDRFSSLPFYLQHTVSVIDSASRDLDFGCRTAAGATCIGMEALLLQNDAGPVVVAVHATRRDDFLATAGTGWRSVTVGKRLLFFREQTRRYSKIQQ